MSKYESVRKIVECVLTCEDEKFKKALAPHINDALENDTENHYLTWGYDEDQSPIELLKEYWGDIADEPDPDVEVNKIECKSVRECRIEDSKKIKDFINSQDAEKFTMFKDKSWIWFYKPTGQHVEAYIAENVDTMLNIEMLKEEIIHILVEKRFEYVIQHISGAELANIIDSKWEVYDHEAHMHIATKIRIHKRIYSIYSTWWEIIMTEVKKRLIGDD